MAKRACRILSSFNCILLLYTFLPRLWEIVTIPNLCCDQLCTMCMRICICLILCVLKSPFWLSQEHFSSVIEEKTTPKCQLLTPFPASPAVHKYFKCHLTCFCYWCFCLKFTQNILFFCCVHIYKRSNAIVQECFPNTQLLKSYADLRVIALSIVATVCYFQTWPNLYLNSKKRKKTFTFLLETTICLDAIITVKKRWVFQVNILS